MVNFDWQDESLKHPDGRANNNEPCIKCGKQIDKKAHWKFRDRHVCSSRCNQSAMRAFKRKVKLGALVEPVPIKAKSPRNYDENYIFGMDLSLSNGIPFGYEGFGPIDGDILFRWEEETFFSIEKSDIPEDTEDDYICAAMHKSGHQVHYYTSLEGEFRRFILGHFFEGKRLPLEETFWHEGRELHWIREIVRCIDGDGIDFDWEAYVCVPVEITDALYWSPEYAERSEKLNRISQYTAGNQNRVLPDTTVDRFDPYEIYERDNWICQICFESVSKTLKHPDLMSATLDHIYPISKGGEHTESNTQLAHLVCNIKKGNKV